MEYIEAEEGVLKPRRKEKRRVRRDDEGEELNNIGANVLDAAITVHRELGPGLLESAYEMALARELTLRGLAIKTQVPVELN